jgi:iron complex transport system permease protein
MKTLTPGRVGAVLLALLLLLLAVVTFGVVTGPSSLTRVEIAAVLRGDDAPAAAADIVLRVRLPRVVLAMLVGAALAVAGVLFQALLRNPLADPFVLGVSGGAALGAILVLSLGSAVGLGYGAVPPAAFAGSVVATVLLYAIAGVRGRVSATNLLLTGVVFNAFASAAIVFLASLSGLTESANIFLWLIGSLSASRADVAPWIGLFLAVGLACALPLARSLNLLTLGDESARQLGVDVVASRRVLLLATHLLRLLLGPDHRLLVPAAALGGAAFLVLCDTLARTLLDGRELPVGAITAVLGGPLFLYLLRRHHMRAFAS